MDEMTLRRGGYQEGADQEAAGGGAGDGGGLPRQIPARQGQCLLTPV